MQTLEYIRAFILGRMAWSRLNGLMLISGAFGAFDREIVLKCGGYNHKTVGEDMELVVRMRRYMEEHHLKYRVTFIPDPLCWTEAPVSFTILGRQRNRWIRGTVETLKFHRKMFFNPKYGVLGMLSYPYWFFFEMCSPVIEFLGFVLFLFCLMLGLIDWRFFASFFGFVICFGYLYSVFAVLMEVITYNQYKRRTDILRLLATALTEPFYFHPFVVWSAIKGFRDLLINKKGWGEMTRQGFARKPGTAPQEQTPPLAGSLPGKAKGLPELFRDYLGYAMVLWLLLCCTRAFELVSDVVRHGRPGSFGKLLALSVLRDLAFFSRFILLIFPLFLLARLANRKAATALFITVSLLLLLLQVSLSEYFLDTLVPLGADLWSYSASEIKQTVAAAGGIPLSLILGMVFLTLCSLNAFLYLPRKIRPGNAFAAFLTAAIILFLAGPVPALIQKGSAGSEYANNLSLNKSAYFMSSAFDHLFPAQMEENTASGAIGASNGFYYPDVGKYPFFHALDTGSNTLSAFFTNNGVRPNIVIILVEGLGRAFTNEGAYLGNFTPFLDSLSGVSLYWTNFVSAGGRTFAALPSLIGSLPFGRNGFSELAEKMPSHLSLLSVLRLNGYQTSFHYGGDGHFDNMDLFLKKGRIGAVYDEKTFSGDYSKMPSQTGFTWGFGDKELFRHYFETQKPDVLPYAAVMLTLSTHSPFLIDEEDAYLQKFERRMTSLSFDEPRKRIYRNYGNQYASILYFDDALRDFFAQYAKRADFKNSVFLITGDHRMPEIPMRSKLDRYHVPLIIYSPLLKRTAVFSSVSSHFDITPSLLAWLAHDYHLTTPHSGSWMGSGLDTNRAFRNIHAYPMMQTKNDLVDFIMGDFMLNGSDLYRIDNNMDLEPTVDDRQAKALKAAFDLFKRKNESLLHGAPLIPDSLYRRYFPK
jgi:peptidoglycan-N-acetylglucosamine deacetylase